MEAEAKPLIEGLGLKRDEPSLIPPPAPAVTFSGSKGGAKIHVVCNGRCCSGGLLLFRLWICSSAQTHADIDML